MESLKRRIRCKNETVYAYILTSVKADSCGKEFCQKGCAPNFQGGILTLFTCMHAMRTYSTIRDRSNRDVWIAGLTGSMFKRQRNYMFYLMRVGERFDSHFEAWNSNLLSKVREAKAADLTRFGDMYRPRSRNIKEQDQLSPSSYCGPHDNHPHRECQAWHRDIAYKRGKNMAVLVAGDTNSSFLWKTPKIALKERMPRLKKSDLSELLGLLRTVPG